MGSRKGIWIGLGVVASLVAIAAPLFGWATFYQAVTVAALIPLYGIWITAVKTRMAVEYIADTDDFSFDYLRDIGKRIAHATTPTDQKSNTLEEILARNDKDYPSAWRFDNAGNKLHGWPAVTRVADQQGHAQKVAGS